MAIIVDRATATDIPTGKKCIMEISWDDVSMEVSRIRVDNQTDRMAAVEFVRHSDDKRFPYFVEPNTVRDEQIPKNMDILYEDYGYSFGIITG